jgi:HK97 family phage major capsid protein
MVPASRTEMVNQLTYVRERHALEERQSAFESTRPLIAKLNRGARLTREERSQLAATQDRIMALNLEISEFREARNGSAAAAPPVPSFGSDDSDAESRAFVKYLRTGEVSPELRAAGESTGAGGGFLVPPGWWQRLQVAKKAFGGTASDFELVETESGNPMQWATVDPTAVFPSAPIGENTQVADQDYVFGQGTMGAYMFTSGVQKVSFQLDRDSAFNMDSFIQARVNEALGRAEAAMAISGTGSSQPLGIITALNAATGLTSGGTLTLGTAQKVRTVSSTPATAGEDTTKTELTGNVLAPSTVLSLIKAVDLAYYDGAKFYLNNNVLQNMKGIVDAFGRPYYPNLRDASPTLEGFPVVIDQNIPNLTASTASGAIFGRLRDAMVIRRVTNEASILRLQERYADFLQVGYLGFERYDIRSNDLRAAVVAKPAGT